MLLEKCLKCGSEKFFCEWSTARTGERICFFDCPCGHTWKQQMQMVLIGKLECERCPRRGPESFNPKKGKWG